MNYEEKYKQALERARKLATDLPNGRADRLYHVSDLEAIFPELKDNEGRIAACIGMCLTDANEQRFKEYNTTLKDCLAWLEKQGEKSEYNPYKATVESIAEMCKSYSTSTNLHDFYDNVRVKCKDAMEYDKTWTEKQGEQKPTDEEMKTILQTEYEKGRADIIAEMQKSSWSEEDDYIYNEILKRVADKKLYEHDLEYINTWLKSIKHNHWKPTKNQMSMLLAVIHDGNNANSESCHNVLQSLYNDLKNL